MPQKIKPLPREMESLAGDFRGLLAQIGSVNETFSAYAFASASDVVDAPSLKKFLRAYCEQLLFPVELPAVCKAFLHASRYECRELIALDQALSRDGRLQVFSKASAAVGQFHLRTLRPLRENRLVQRYIAALDAGEVQAWHTLVYGLSLSVYSVPLRQGLLTYAELLVDGLAEATNRKLQIPQTELRAIMEEVLRGLPSQVETILQPTETLFKAA